MSLPFLSQPVLAAAFGYGLIVGAAVTLAAAGIGAIFVVCKFVQLERRTARAERLGELGMLTAGLAHEIKNPLSTLQLNLQLLSEQLDDRMDRLAVPRSDELEERKKVLGRMRRRLDGVTKEAGRLREILDGFLRYAGRIEPERKPTPLAEVAEDLIDFLEPQASAARVRVTAKTIGDASSLTAKVDENLIRQALLNLLLNAIQFTPEGGSVTLTVRPDRLSPPTRAAVRIDVSDTGPGIAANDLPRLFDPYYTRRKGGTGLGLAITRRIIDAHDGTVTANSSAGGGATFTILLPRQ